MGATRIEFRLRLLIVVAFVGLGFWAPWIEAWGLGRRISLLEWLALELSRLASLPFAISTAAVIGLASLLALIGALLRVWGAAWLGPEVVQHRRMQARGLLASGPYRFMRNPLYLGSWFTVAALSFLMPAGGAPLAVAAVVLFQLRLILGEEAFLSAQLGDSYLAYKQAVPRLLPRLKTTVQPERRRPQWLHALLAEIFPIGLFVILAALSWRYDLRLMAKAILVCFGIALVARGLGQGRRGEA